MGKDEALHRFTTGDPYLHARAKVNYHWRKARWHALNALGFIPGDRCLHARAKVNYHWHKARWHALNALGVTPSCLPTSFDLAPLALVSWRGGETAMGSRKSIGISSLACYEMWVKHRLAALAACATGLAHAAARLSSLALKSIAKTIAATKTDPTT